jgi:hypothetical protein
MSDLSWYERHLGGVIPARAPEPPNGYPQKAVRWAPSYPPTGPRQEVVVNQPGGNGDDSYDQVQRQGFIAKPPPSMMAGGGDCPGCGGHNYFRRRWAHTEAAPLCTDCGYNGDHFTQSGTLLNAVGIRSSGPVSFARTDNPSGESNFNADPGVSSDFSWSQVR